MLAVSSLRNAGNFLANDTAQQPASLGIYTATALRPELGEWYFLNDVYCRCRYEYGYQVAGSERRRVSIFYRTVRRLYRHKFLRPLEEGATAGSPYVLLEMR